MTDNNTQTDKQNNTQTEEQKPFYEREMSAQSGILGWKGFANPPQPKPDTLTLEYPALAPQINSALAQGVDRNKLRKYLAERESIALMQYPMSQVNQFLGRDEKSVKNLVEEMQRQKDNAYVQIMKYDMSEGKVRDILKTAQLSGITPGVLFRNPDILSKAEDLAGRREGFWGQAVAAVRNMFANYNQSSVGDELTKAADTRRIMQDDRTMRDEGLRIWNAGLKTTLLPPPDDELIAMGRDSYEKRAKELEEAAKIDAQDVERWADHVRPPDSWLGNLAVNAIQNWGFTGMAMLRSSAGWWGGMLMGGPAGAPIGLAIMSAYNTIDESEREAGEAFMEAERRGKSPEEALQIAKEVRAKNMLYLPASNYGADYIFYKGAELIGRYTAPWFTRGFDFTRMENIIRYTKPNLGIAGKTARFVINNAVPFVLDAQTEGFEEYFQEMFKMQALDDEIDQSALWDAFKLGAADTVLYTLAGSLINKGLRAGGAKVYSMTPKGKAQQRAQQQLNSLMNNVQELQQLTDQIQQGNIKPDDIVGENPIVFVPRSKLNEESAQALGITQELIETESGEFVAEDNSNVVETDNTEAAALQNLEGITGLEDLEEQPVTQQETQPEESVDDEVAVRKSDWDKFAAENPQEAQELQPFVREGTEGITASEQLQEKWKPIVQAANENPEVREAIPKLTQALINAGRSEEEAQTLATVTGAVANSMSKRYSNINAAQVMNLTAAEAIINSQEVAQGSTAEGTPATPSNTARIRTMKGTEVDVRYRIVDADSLIVSTLENGSPNPNYPQRLQPRQRDREASRIQIDRISAKLDPELLGANRMASDGAPVIGPDMVVESGNGRIMGIRKAYKTDKAENYRAWLRDNAGMFGLTVEEIDSVKSPVLVRERTSNVNRVQFSIEANQSSVASMSAAENAMSDAKKLTTSLLNLYDTERSFEANSKFIAAAIGKLPVNERGALVQRDGKISRAGVDRVRNALISKAYKDTSIIERLSEFSNDNIKNISNALIQAAPKIAVFENSDRRNELSLQGDIANAVNTLAHILETKQKVSEYVAQPALFREDDLAEAGTKLLEFFDRNKRSAKRIASMLTRYAELAMNEAGDRQTVLLEDSVRSKESLLDEAIKFAENTESQQLAINFESYNQPAQRESVATSAEFRDALNELFKYRNFPRIPDLRKALGWPREVFDEMIRRLRDSNNIQIGGDGRRLNNLNDEAEGNFVDENGFVRNTIIWSNGNRNGRIISDVKIPFTRQSTPQATQSTQNNRQSTQSILSISYVSAIDMKQAYDELHKFREFVRICDVRRSLGWPREVFDEMIRTLRDDRTIRIMRADQSILTRDEVADCFVDENNFIMGTIIWNNENTSFLQNISIPVSQQQDTSQQNTSASYEAQTETQADPTAAFAHFVLQFMETDDDYESGSVSVSNVRQAWVDYGFDDGLLDVLIGSLQDNGIIQLQQEGQTLRINDVDALRVAAYDFTAQENTPQNLSGQENIAQGFSEQEEGIQQEDNSIIVDNPAAEVLAQLTTGNNNSVGFVEIRQALNNQGLNDAEASKAIMELQDAGIIRLNLKPVSQLDLENLDSLSNLEVKVLRPDLLPVVEEQANDTATVNDVGTEPDMSESIAEDNAQPKQAWELVATSHDPEAARREVLRKREENIKRGKMHQKLVNFILNQVGFDITPYRLAEMDKRNSLVIRWSALNPNQQYDIKSLASEYGGGYYTYADSGYDQMRLTFGKKLKQVKQESASTVREQPKAQKIQTQQETQAQQEEAVNTPQIKQAEQENITQAEAVQDNIAQVEEGQPAQQQDKAVDVPQVEQGEQENSIQAEEEQTIQEAASEEGINARSLWPEGTSSIDTATLIEFFTTANESSGIHELGHHIFRVLTDAAQLNNASEELLQDVNTIFKNAGVKAKDFYSNKKDARIKAHEYFSTAFETYIAEGKAPVKELQSTFDRIKTWLVDVYHNVTQALGIQLNDEMREIFDKLLASPEQFAEEQPLQDVTAMYKAGEAEIARLQQEISQLEQEARNNSQQWKDTVEEAYIRGKNRGEDYGIKEGREYQRKVDKAKQEEAVGKAYAKGEKHGITEGKAEQRKVDKARLEKRIAKLKERFAELKARQKERQRIRNKARKLVENIARMAGAQNIIWSRQQEIKTLLDTYYNDKLGKLSFQNIQYMHDMIKKIYDTGRREMKAKQLIEYERVEGLRQQLRETLEGLIPDEKGAVRNREDLQRQYEGARGVIQKAIDWTMAKTMGAQRFFDYLDTGKKGHKGAHYNGVWVKTFVDEANRAYDTELRFKFARLAAFEKTMQDLGITSKMLSQTRDVDVPHVGNRKWTVDELMSIYAGMKNPRSRDAILYGNFKEAGDQAEAWAAKCIEALTDEERALADAVIREYEENRERINQALIDIYNKGMAYEENYTPMRRLEYTAQNGSWLNPDAGEGMLAGQQGSGMGNVQKGFAERRRNFNPMNQNPIDLGLVKIWHSQVELQEHTAAFGQLVKDLRRVLLGRGENERRTIRQMIKQAYGQNAWEMVRRYFNILANNDTQQAYDTLEGLSRIMAKNMSIAYLCGNLGTMLKQLNSFARVLPYAGPVHMINAIGQFMQNPKAFMEQCYQLDPQLRNRKGDPFIRELQGDSNGLYKTLLQWGSEPIGWTDRAASAVAFKAVYDANIKHGLSQEQAVREAQRAVLLTQPATHIKDKPLVWQQNGYAKLAMMFTNDMAQTFGLTLYDLTQQIRNGEVPKALSSVVGLTLAATLIRLITSGAPDEPDDPEEWAKWIAGAFAEQEIQSIPIIGKEALALWDARNGYFNRNSAFIAPFAKLAAGAKGLWDDKNDNNERAIFNLLEGGSLLAPFPATALKRLWGMLKESGKGEVLRALGRLVGIRLEDKKFIRRAYSR